MCVHTSEVRAGHSFPVTRFHLHQPLSPSPSRIACSARNDPRAANVRLLRRAEIQREMHARHETRESRLKSEGGLIVQISERAVYLLLGRG